MLSAPLHRRHHAITLVIASPFNFQHLRKYLYNASYLFCSSDLPTVKQLLRFYFSRGIRSAQRKESWHCRQTEQSFRFSSLFLCFCSGLWCQITVAPSPAVITSVSKPLGHGLFLLQMLTDLGWRHNCFLHETCAFLLSRLNHLRLR